MKPFRNIRLAYLDDLTGDPSLNKYTRSGVGWTKIQEVGRVEEKNWAYFMDGRMYIDKESGNCSINEVGSDQEDTITAYKNDELDLIFFYKPRDFGMYIGDQDHLFMILEWLTENYEACGNKELIAAESIYEAV